MASFAIAYAIGVAIAVLVFIALYLLGGDEVDWDSVAEDFG